MNQLLGLDVSMQSANEWLREIGDGLGIQNRRTEYAALRGTLHVLRDHLSTDEIAQLSAQLPIVIRGIFYEGWNPKATVSRPRNKAEFLNIVRTGLKGHEELGDVEKTVKVTLGVLANHVSAGEIMQVIHSLPAGIRELWIQSPVS